MKKKKIVIIGILTIILVLISTFFVVILSSKIILIGKEKVSLEVGSTYKEEGCRVNILWWKTSCQIKKDPTFDEKKIGTYQTIYKTKFPFLNKKKTRKITFVDRTPPVITLKGRDEVSIYLGEEYQEEGFEVVDNYDKDLTERVTITSTVDSTKIGQYEIVYEVEDTSHNKASVKRQIEVKEKPQENKTPVPVSQVGTYINGILIVNKQYHLPQSYRPGINQTAYQALRSLQKEAKEQGLSLPLVSGFRSYEDQKYIYNNYVLRDGEELANTYSARPGESEHQTGLAFDIGVIDNDFGDTPEGIWLNENAHRFGFIIRYLKGKEQITGYQYEPWHIRYVGDVAPKIKEQNVTLEEYLGLY